MRVQRPRVLLIDDDEDSQVITRNLLSRAREIFDLDWQRTYQAGLDALRLGRHDVCLLDFHLGSHDGLELLREAIARGCHVPIIMLTGQGDYEIDLQAMKSGATDYLVKDGLTSALLERALRFAIERRRTEDQRLRNEGHLRLLTDHLPATLWTTDRELRFTSSLGSGLLGPNRLPDELVGTSLFDLFGSHASVHPLVAGHVQTLEARPASFEITSKGRVYQIRLEPLHQGNCQTAGVIGVAVDITENRRVAEGFRIAGKIQQRLLPARAPELPGFEIAGVCYPAEATGGDFFDYIPMRDGSLGIVVADVSSHGFAPALIMAGTRRLLRTLAQDSNDLGAILRAANRAVEEDTASDLFVTVFFTRLDVRTRELHYCGAGHEGYVVGPSGPPEKLAAVAPPLGVDDDIDLPCVPPVQLQPGQILALLTDGFAEAMSPEDRLFGLERALALIQAERHRPAAEILDRLYREVCEFCRPDRPHDDLTCVLVKVPPAEG